MIKNLLNLSKKTTLALILLCSATNIHSQCVQSFYDDFETGSFNPPWVAGTGHTVTINNTTPAEGAFSMDMTGLSAFYAGPNVQFASSQPTSIEWWTKTNNVTAANGYFIVGDANIASNNGIVFCYFNATSSLRFFNSAGYNYPITVNTWYHIELKNINWTAKTFDIYINNVIWQTAFAFRTPASTDMTQLHVFNLSSATSSYDKIVIGDVPPTLTVSNSSPTLCAGSTVTLTAAGNATAYVWSNSVTNAIGFTPTATAVYSVVATGSNSCQNSATTTVNVNQSPTVSIVPSNTAICDGTTATLTANGASTYTWNTTSNSQSIAINPTVTTNYTVSGTNTLGCEGTSTISLIVNQIPTVTATSNASIICTGQTASLTAGGAATYSWNTSSTNASIAVSPTTTTSYTVTGTTNGCSNSFVITQSVSNCTGLYEKATLTSPFLVYPNPSNGIFIIKTENSIDLTITDALGKIIRSVSLNNNEQLEVKGLANGLYFITGLSSNNYYKVKVVIAN
ncbi:MAG: T9SS type A sorting domain-containing protein [Bacteroidota bacterium]|nr:T9SS type A sorting domain-containing protein [Bacteroidota bacterium]